MKKLFLIIALFTVAVTVVACAVNGTTEPSSSEITRVTPTGSAAEATEASEPTQTSSKPEVTDPYVAGEPAFLDDAATLSSLVIETEDKIFPKRSLYSSVSYGNLYEYYSKVDGKMHVFCDDPNCDHKNFDGEKFTPKCAACLISDPRVLSLSFDIVYFRDRLYFTNFGELFSANKDGGDVRLELSVSDKREPYEMLAANPEREMVSSSSATVRLDISSQDGQYIYVNAIYDNDIQPTLRFNVLSKEVVNISEKVSALKEKLGIDFGITLTRGNGKIYVMKYHEINDPENGIYNLRVYDDELYEITPDFEDIVPSSDVLGTSYVFYTAEGKFIRNSENEYNKLILLKENGERETVIEDIKGTLGDEVRFLYIDANYVYYTYLTSIGHDLNLGKIFKIPNTRLNDSHGKILRYDRNAKTAVDNVEMISGVTKKSGAKTEIKDANGTVYGYYELYDITLIKNPYYLTKMNSEYMVTEELYYDSSRTVKDARGYFYYAVDTGKTTLIALINQTTMKQEIDDGLSYNDTSTYYVDPLTKYVYLIHGTPVYLSTTSSSKPKFEGYKTVEESDVRRLNTAVLDNVLIDSPDIVYIDGEKGTALLSISKLFITSHKNINEEDVMHFGQRHMLATCDIDGAGRFVNITPVLMEVDYNENHSEEFEINGYSSTDNHVVETKYALYSFDQKSKNNNDIVSYYFKPDKKMRALCADSTCDHAVFDGKVVHTTCPAAMMGDLYATYTGANDVTPIFYDSRFYFVFFQEIYSCDEFGGDLRLEVSLDKERGLYDMIYGDTDPASCEVPKIRINNFLECGGKLYFKYTTKNGDVKFLKFDPFTKELTDLTPRVETIEKAIGGKVRPLEVKDGKIVFIAFIQSRTTYFSTSDDYKTFDAIDPVPTWLFKTDKGMITEDFIDGKWKLVLVKPNGDKEIIVEDRNAAVGSYSNLLYITDDYIYYYKYENVSIGKHFNLSGSAGTSVSGGKILRYNIKTGENKVVLDNIEYDEFEIFRVDEENRRVFMCMYVLESDGSRVVGSFDYYHAKISRDEFVLFEKVRSYS